MRKHYPLRVVVIGTVRGNAILDTPGKLCIMPEVRQPSYSRLQHLAYALWLNHDPRFRFMGMFTVYTDASGHDAAPGPMFVCGFVSSVEKWLKFERAWLSLLDTFGIENPFHMTDFAVGAPPYDTWKADKEGRASFMQQALKMINKYKIKDFAHGVNVSDFRRMHKVYVIPPRSGPAVLSTPFSYCATQAALSVLDWTNRYVKKKGARIDGPLEFVYDRGEKHHGHFSKIIREQFAGIEPIWRNKKDAVPLQAADLVAWELARAWKEIERKSTRRPRASFLEINRILPGSREWTYAHWPSLSAYCEEQGFVKREDDTVPRGLHR